MSLVNGRREGVLVEGTLGALRSAGFVEDSVLEVAGDKGVLRVSLRRDDLNGPAKSGEVEA